MHEELLSGSPTRSAESRTRCQGGNQMSDKHVYRFSEGNKDHEGAPRRQGGEPRRDDDASGCPCRPASPSPPRSATTTRPTATIPRASTPRSRTRSSALEADTGKTLRRRLRPAAPQRALRRPRLHAGHDGHDPQPGPQRRRPSRASSPPPATRASPTTATGASSACTATSCSAASRRATTRATSSRSASRR